MKTEHNVITRTEKSLDICQTFPHVDAARNRMRALDDAAPDVDPVLGPLRRVHAEKIRP